MPDGAHLGHHSGFVVAGEHVVLTQQCTHGPSTSSTSGSSASGVLGVAARYTGMMYDSGRAGVPTQKRKVFSGVTSYGHVG